jgi:DNA-directed RNA polymerase subunit RPC12/RpoP
MTEDIKKQIIERVYEKMYETEINCPECESMVDDHLYTCTTCWTQGGNGKIQLSNLFQNIGDCLRFDE